MELPGCSWVMLGLTGINWLRDSPNHPKPPKHFKTTQKWAERVIPKYPKTNASVPEIFAGVLLGSFTATVRIIAHLGAPHADSARGKPKENEPWTPENSRDVWALGMPREAEDIEFVGCLHGIVSH